jgi:tetratricopeptide (TPR) repeat protein
MEAAAFRPPAASVEAPFYYLDNFQTVVEWVLARYRDLLTADECAMLDRFALLPLASRALLVRMIMRKGTVFRASKLSYVEIGATNAAAQPLVDAGWIAIDGLIDIGGLCALLVKDEIATLFDQLPTGGRKTDWLAALARQFPQPRRFSEWFGDGDCAYTLLWMPLCDRLRLMFFGNLHQDWTEFILADLGIWRYETVEFAPDCRAFHTRADVDHYLQLHRCRERLDSEEPLPAIIAELLQMEIANPWAQARRMKLLFRIGQDCERAGELEQALALYEQSRHAGSRTRRIRVLERLQRFAEALALCEAALLAPESDAELQQLQRQLPRLRRHAGAARLERRATRDCEHLDLVLQKPAGYCRVEGVVQQYLGSDDAPVHYVENALINSLFGLLCWEAIFAPLPGAFFHPFQHGPADLHDPEFQRRRQPLFERLFAQLDSGEHGATIRANFRAKQGLQSPFVYWSAIDETLLELALLCMPAADLRTLFERLLRDPRANRAGLPDLIQFWPSERRYRMIEVKGPGDRLQDNQKRWLDYCAQHSIPVAVCYVQWQDAA